MLRTAADPDATLLGFLERTYGAAADSPGWGRAALEVDPHRWSTADGEPCGGDAGAGVRDLAGVAPSA